MAFVTNTRHFSENNRHFSENNRHQILNTRHLFNFRPRSAIEKPVVIAYQTACFFSTGILTSHFAAKFCQENRAGAT
jgi:hypothetical protein